MPVSSAAIRGPSPLPRRLEVHALLRRDRARQVAPVHRRLREHPLHRGALRRLPVEHPAAHRAAIADVPDERAGVDPAQRGHAAVREPGQPPSLGARRVLAVHALAHHHRARVHAVRLTRLVRHAVVAHERVGEDDDLAVVARVGHGLLVARHRGVEHHLAGGLDGRGARNRRSLPVEAGPVLEQEIRRPGGHRYTASIANDRSR